MKMSDQDLHDSRLDAAYRDASREQPPVEIDERIRAAARRAVSVRPRSLEAHAATVARRSWSARWRVPLSLAATVVLAVTVTLLMQEEEGRKLREESPAAVSVPEPQTPAQPGTPPPVSQPSQPESATASQQAKRSQSAPAASPSVAEDAARRAERMVPESSSRAFERPREPTREPATLPPVADSAAPTRERDAMQVAPEAPSGSDFTRPLSSDRANAERPNRELRSATAGASAGRTAEQWIEEIRRLKNQGRDAEAAAELAEFRRRFPDYSLPSDLARQP